MVTIRPFATFGCRARPRAGIPGIAAAKRASTLKPRALPRWWHAGTGARFRPQQQRDQPSPASLVGGSETAAGIAVKIFVKKRMVAEVRIVAEQWRGAERRTVALLVGKEQPGEPTRQLGPNLRQVHIDAGPGRTLDLEIGAVIAVKAAQRLDQQEIDRHPDWTAPVRVAAEQARSRLARHVGDAMLLSAVLEEDRVLAMVFRQ